MSKIAAPIVSLALVASSLAAPTSATAAPPTNTQDNLAACRGTVSEDPNISLGGCLGFVQTIYVSHDHGWIPHYCAGLAYYEPDVFASLYDSQAECIQANEGNPPF